MFFETPIFEIAILFNEVSMALRPTVMQAVGSDVSTQVLIHHLCFIVLGLCLAKPSEIASVFDTSLKNMFRHLGMATLSFIIVSLTYFSYKELPLEISMPIVYSYPWILAALSIIVLKTQEYEYLLPMLITYAMLVYHVRPKAHHIERFKSLTPEKQDTKYRAIAAAIGAMLLIGFRSFIYKSGAENHVTGTLRTYICMLLVVCIGFFINKKYPDMRPEAWAKLIVFNVCIAFAASRFKIEAMKQVSPMYIASFIFMAALIVYTISQKYPQLKSKGNKDFEHST